MKNIKEKVRKDLIEKKCNGKCGQIKLLSEFNKKSAGVSGYQSWCKHCVNKYKQEYRKKKNINEKYECLQCNKTYNLKDSLKRHIKEKH
jgi:hypothetical protein